MEVKVSYLHVKTKEPLHQALTLLLQGCHPICGWPAVGCRCSACSRQPHLMGKLRISRLICFPTQIGSMDCIEDLAQDLHNVPKLSSNQNLACVTSSAIQRLYAYYM